MRRSSQTLLLDASVSLRVNIKLGPSRRNETSIANRQHQFRNILSSFVMRETANVHSLSALIVPARNCCIS
jgi:hypothetical protein